MDLDPKLKSINSINSSQFLREREELERRKLQKMIWDGEGPPSAKKGKRAGEAGDDFDAAGAAGGAGARFKTVVIDLLFDF